MRKKGLRVSSSDKSELGVLYLNEKKNIYSVILKFKRFKVLIDIKQQQCILLTETETISDIRVIFYLLKVKRHFDVTLTIKFYCLLYMNVQK